MKKAGAVKSRKGIDRIGLLVEKMFRFFPSVSCAALTREVFGLYNDRAY
jgi:hypothetical protein